MLTVRISTTMILWISFGPFLGLHVLEKASDVFGGDDFSLFREFAQKVVERSLHVVVTGNKFTLLESESERVKLVVVLYKAL